tara:strand:+ start:113 stop:313 length:201 start_codon:yes stop_codon:yes gene_type:complete
MTEKQTPNSIFDAGRSDELHFSSRESRWAWIRAKGFEDFVRLCAEHFGDENGKIETPRCYKGLHSV